MEPLKSGDPTQLGDWRIMGRLGEGGFGTVFLAEKGAQKSALKVIRDEFVEDEGARERLITEAEVLSNLSNPYIGRILDSDLDCDSPWIATEFINGPTLDNKVKYEGPLEEITWFNLAANLFHAIVAANELKIIHKDIKPSNIILGETGNKLIDFGIAHVSGRTKTAIYGDREGSTPFSSPEHFTPRSNPKMDVFSAAATLAFAGTGRSVWVGDNDLQLMRSINGDSPNLKGLTDNQVNFLIPLFEKNPSDRSTAAEALKSALSYIEYMLGKTGKPTPPKISGRRFFSLKSKVEIYGIALATITSATLIFYIVNGTPNLRVVGSELTTETSLLTAEQTQRAAACENLASYGDFEAAIVSCQEPAELGDAMAQYSLAYSFEELGNLAERDKWAMRAAEQELPDAMALVASIEMNKGNYSAALRWGKKAAESGNLVGYEAVGIAYAYLGEMDLAVDWYKKSWEMGDIQGARNLGYHYWFESYDKAKASKWLKIAAETNSSVQDATAFDYAEFLRRELKNESDSCAWYEKSANAGYKEGKKDAVKAFEKYCVSNANDSNVTISDESKKQTTKPKESVKESTAPVDPEKAIASSDSLRLSAPLSQKVQVDSIFGRAFKSGGLYWRIPITNFKDEKVPALTGIQFRLIGYPDMLWSEVPYKLKTEEMLSSVYAEVDDFIFAFLFKDIKYCPEFRVVREERGEIVRIWNKGQPECANDYIP